MQTGLKHFAGCLEQRKHLKNIIIVINMIINNKQ